MTVDEPDHRPDMAGATRDVLARIIERSGVEPAAHEAIRDAHTSAGDLRRMATEYEYALGVHVGDTYRAAAEGVHPGITAEEAWPSVAQRLHRADAAGWRIGDILQAAEQMGSYTDARSDAAVLVFRLDRLLARTPHDTHATVPTWLAVTPPTGTDAAWDGYLTARYAEIDQRITTLAARAVDEPARWLPAVGHGPGRDEAIRQTVAYRAVFAIDGDDPLGPAPERRGRQHDAWTAAHHALQTSHHTPQEPSAAARLLEILATTRTTGVDDDRPTDTRTGPTIHH